MVRDQESIVEVARAARRRRHRRPMSLKAHPGQRWKAALLAEVRSAARGVESLCSSTARRRPDHEAASSERCGPAPARFGRRPPRLPRRSGARRGGAVGRYRAREPDDPRRAARPCVRARVRSLERTQPRKPGDLQRRIGSACAQGTTRSKPPRLVKSRRYTCPVSVRGSGRSRFRSRLRAPVRRAAFASRPREN